MNLVILNNESIKKIKKRAQIAKNRATFSDPQHEAEFYHIERSKVSLKQFFQSDFQKDYKNNMSR